MTRFVQLSLILLLFFPIIILAQSHIAFSHLTVEDGLSQSSVTCILQDSQGFMWFGTQDGLNRYDGYKFNLYKHNSSDSTSLTDNFIFSIYEDKSGQLYIETQSGALHEFLPGTESFKVVSKETLDFDKLRVNTVQAKLQDKNGIRWTGGLGDPTGLERLDTKTGQSTLC